MDLKERFLRRLGVDPQLTIELQKAKARYDAERSANRVIANLGQEALNFDQERLWRARQIEVETLAIAVIRVYKPTLEAIKKGYLGWFKGNIVIDKDYNNGQVTLELKWDVTHVTESSGGGRSYAYYPVEKGKHFYFKVDADGRGVFGPVENKLQEADDYGMRRPYMPMGSEIFIRPGDEGWKVGLADMISSSIKSGRCNYTKRLKS